MLLVLAGVIALILAVVHIFAGRLRFLDVIPRSRTLSFAGGVAVAYVFVHVLPELAERQEVMEDVDAAVIEYLDHHMYLIAMVGLAVFYGLERVVRESRRERAEESGEDVPASDIFWLHIGSFALYNTLIGYLLLHREEHGIWSLTLFGVAIALHFLTNDFGLRKDHKQLYDRLARWILAVAVLAGFVIGITITVSDTTIAILFAFLSGAIILNVLKEELPEEQRSRFWPFALGTAVYSAVLLLV